jgi:hypothetical protein
MALLVMHIHLVRFYAFFSMLWTVERLGCCYCYGLLKPIIPQLANVLPMGFIKRGWINDGYMQQEGTSISLVVVRIHKKQGSVYFLRFIEAA